MVSDEYLRFMQILLADDVSDNVRKLANIILLHLEELMPLGTAHGKRTQKLVQLAQQEIKTASAVIASTTESAPGVQQTITRLKGLTVGPFRGFAKQETFDLDSHIVLIYGPNGAGKSSFCEALEYGLLGSVQEAESRRFTRTNDYLKNAHTGSFYPPVLSAIIPAATTQTINAEEALYRFCFVEKNRIDNFSRIAAYPPARQTELISSLFGLDAFNDFVKNFSSSLDAKYIDLVGVKTSELKTKQSALEGHKQTIATNTTALESLVAEEQALADSYQKDIKFSDFVVALGTGDHPGEIQQLEEEITKPAPVLTGIKLVDLEKSRQEIEGVISNLKTTEENLSKSSEGLSYKKLYQAVAELNSLSGDCCPACKTPLGNVRENPFHRAANGLIELAHLATLEQERDTLVTNLQTALKVVHEKMRTVCSLLQPQAEQPESKPLGEFLVDTDVKLDIAWWGQLIQEQDNVASGWLTLEQQFKILEAKDVSISKALEKIKRQKDRLKDLRELSDKAIAIKSRRTTLEEAGVKARKAIADFEEENKVLIKSAKAETAVVDQNKEIAEAYSQFVARLNSYSESLPAKLLLDLGSRIVEIYNAINRSDAPGDLLSELKLPTTSGERIEISFNNDPDIYFDALHVLSEGHIRCIGLAILLAKNLKEECPLLIFDDPVNAIDDDHRESIRRTLFEDNYFKDKQIILTCHGEEFYKDIQNLLGAERTQASIRFTFLPQSGDKQILVDSESNPRNYVLSAQEHLRKLEIREALAAARRALEVLTKKVWQYVSKYGDGNLSIKMRSATSPIELRNLTEQLKKQLSHTGFTHPQKDKILQRINTILGPDGNSREWRYLNKGTHDENDRAEFDRSTVTQIINELTNLDRELSM